MRRQALIVTLLLLMPVGCATPLPTHTWVDHATAMETLSRRSDHVKTVSSTCRVLLTNEDGRSTQLSGAMAARPPDELRLRAWKLSQPVLDLTLTPSGLWLFRAKRAEETGEDAFTTLSADRMRAGWTLAMGGFSDPGWAPLDDTGGRTFRTRRTGDGGLAVIATIERRTLTSRQIELIDDDGQTRLTLSLGEYRLVDGIPWPTRLTFRAERGTITVLLDDVELNVDLPARAFTPPRRAIKQP